MTVLHAVLTPALDPLFIAYNTAREKKSLRAIRIARNDCAQCFGGMDRLSGYEGENDAKMTVSGFLTVVFRTVATYTPSRPTASLATAVEILFTILRVTFFLPRS